MQESEKKSNLLSCLGKTTTVYIPLVLFSVYVKNAHKVFLNILLLADGITN